MAGYLSRLVARSFGLTDLVRPYTASRFAPTKEALQAIDPEAVSVKENNQGTSKVAEQAANNTPAEFASPHLPVSGGPETSSAIEGVPREAMVGDDDVRAAPGSDSEAKTKKDVMGRFSNKSGRPHEGDSIDLGQYEPEAGVIVQESTSEHGSPKKSDLPKVSASISEKPDQRGIEPRPFIDHPLKAPTRSVNMDSSSRPSGLESKHFPHSESIGRPASEPPTIKVHIGRIEVRAVMSGAPVIRREQPTTRPSMTLEEYLRRRDRGRS